MLRLNLFLADWQPILAFEKVLRVIGLVSGRVNVGLPASRTDEWLNLYVEYPIQVFSAVSAILGFPKILRSLAQHFLPQIRRIKQIQTRMCEFLAPEYESRRNALADNAADNESRMTNDTMLQWAWENSNE